MPFIPCLWLGHAACKGAVTENFMSNTEDDIRKTQAFIDEAQRVMGQVEGMMAALGEILIKSGAPQSAESPTQKQLELERELEALLRRYIDIPDAAPGASSAQRAPDITSPAEPGAPRPGRYRPLI
jgi:hypothetical protein